jgi:hypothetical protein
MREERGGDGDGERREKRELREGREKETDGRRRVEIPRVACHRQRTIVCEMIIYLLFSS